MELILIPIRGYEGELVELDATSSSSYPLMCLSRSLRFVTDVDEEDENLVDTMGECGTYVDSWWINESACAYLKLIEVK